MGCNCGAGVSGSSVSIKQYAVVDDISLANTPNLIPAQDKYNTFEEAAQHSEGRFLVAILEQV